MPHHETERAFPASATASKPNIECHNIARFFPPSTWALKNATLSIHEGESVAITGASGSGKSTLLSIIGLLDQPSEGELKILGQNMGTASDAERTVARREHIAFVFQAYHLIAHLNATENITPHPPDARRTGPSGTSACVAGTRTGGFGAPSGGSSTQHVRW